MNLCGIFPLFFFFFLLIRVRGRTVAHNVGEAPLRQLAETLPPRFDLGAARDIAQVRFVRLALRPLLLPRRLGAGGGGHLDPLALRVVVAVAGALGRLGDAVVAAALLAGALLAGALLAGAAFVAGGAAAAAAEKAKERSEKRHGLGSGDAGLAFEMVWLVTADDDDRSARYVLMLK